MGEPVPPVAPRAMGEEQKTTERRMGDGGLPGQPPVDPLLMTLRNDPKYKNDPVAQVLLPDEEKKPSSTPAKTEKTPVQKNDNSDKAPKPTDAPKPGKILYWKSGDSKSVSGVITKVE